MMKRFFGYRVIHSMPLGNVTFFIGNNKNDIKPYATFFKRSGDKNYSWLRSFDDLFSAQKDVIDRAYREIPLIEQSLKEEAKQNGNKA